MAKQFPGVKKKQIEYEFDVVEVDRPERNHAVFEVTLRGEGGGAVAASGDDLDEPDEAFNEFDEAEVNGEEAGEEEAAAFAEDEEAFADLLAEEEPPPLEPEVPEEPPLKKPRLTEADLPPIDDDMVLRMTEYLLEKGTVRLVEFGKNFPGMKKLQLERHFAVTAVEGAKNQWEIALG